MTTTRSRLLPRLFHPSSSSPTAEPNKLKKTWRKLLPHRQEEKPHHECQYCCESKKPSDFLPRAHLPYACQIHLASASNRVCKTCVQASLSAQLDAKVLLEIGCPGCGTPWDPEEVRVLIHARDERKFRRLEALARERGWVPEELPDGETTGTLLEKGARFCPWCRWPFIKDGGCDAMQCVKCFKCFNIEYALILEDKEGNRAAPIIDDIDGVF